MPKYMIEALAQYRMVYCVECDDLETALSAIKNSDVEEVGQKYLGEVILSTREVDNKEVLRVFDEVNDYLTKWSDETKLGYVSVIDKDGNVVYPEDADVSNP